MSENMIIKDEINFISNKFRKLADESFDKEKILYEKIWGDDSPNNVKSLYEQVNKIYFLIDNFLDTNNFLMALRNNNFYNALVTKIIQDENSGAEKVVEEDEIHTFIQNKIKETAQRRDNKDLQRTTANTIYSVIYHLIKDKNVSVSYKDIITNFNITFLSVSTEENIENNTSSVGEITIRQRAKTQDGRRGLVLWNKQDTSNLIKTIEDKYKIKISKKGGDFYILTPQQLNSLSQDKTLIDIFVDTIKANFSTEKGIGEMIKWIEENESKINTRLKKEPKLQELLTGQKTLEQVKGDIGELIVNLILGMILESDGIYDKEKNFLGSQFGKKSLGTGQMAVDLALKNIGFQVKNFPSSEWKDSITLYEQQNVLYTDGEIYYDKTEGNRYMDSKNWEKIAFYGMEKEILKEDIIEILVNALPNYLRYSENIIGNKQLEALTQLKNNFYIINFRIIPASIIFLELSEFLEKEASDKISKMFYYTLKKTSDSNNENNIENNINKELKPSRDLFTSGRTVLFAFKGINLFKPKDLNNIKKNLVNFGGKVNG